MTNQEFRVGTGYTVLHWPGSADGKPVKFCTEIADQAPRPTGGGTVDIQPLDAPAPIEIAFSKSAGSGTLTLGVYEEWDYEVWQRIPGYENVGIDTSGDRNDDDDDALPQDTIVRILRRSARKGGVQVTKIIKSPGDRGNKNVRKKIYHGCVITNVNDSETITINTMEVTKRIEVKYRYSTRLGNRAPSA